MIQTVEAVYKNGILEPKQPLTLAEGTVVRLTLRPVDEDYDPLASVIGIGASGRTDGADNHDKYIYGVRVVPQRAGEPNAPTAKAAESRSYGIIGWNGDHETLGQILVEAEELP